MATKLKDTEQQVLEKALSNVEKNVLFWPKLRWFQLFLSLFLIAGSVFSFWQMQSVSEKASFEEIGIEQTKTVEVLERLIDLKVNALEMELRAYYTAILLGSFGMILLFSALASWRGKANEISTQALLRNLLLSQRSSNDDT